MYIHILGWIKNFDFYILILQTFNEFGLQNLFQYFQNADFLKFQLNKILTLFLNPKYGYMTGNYLDLIMMEFFYFFY